MRRCVVEVIFRANVASSRYDYCAECYQNNTNANGSHMESSRYVTLLCDQKHQRWRSAEGETVRWSNELSSILNQLCAYFYKQLSEPVLTASILACCPVVVIRRAFDKRSICSRNQ